VTGWKPALAPGALLRHDPVRQAELLIVPERIVVLSAEAAAIIRLCDGTRTVGQIVSELGVPGIEEDVSGFVASVRGEGWLR
jgi:pyrroloquinoline quinone biosynthesis protein D